MLWLRESPRNPKLEACEERDTDDARGSLRPRESLTHAVTTKLQSVKDMFSDFAFGNRFGDDVAPLPVQQYLLSLFTAGNLVPAVAVKKKQSSFKGFTCPVGFLRDPIKKYVLIPLRRKWRRMNKSGVYPALLSSLNQTLALLMSTTLARIKG
eukprot:2715474-Rhodomonas_salina.2